MDRSSQAGARPSRAKGLRRAGVVVGLVLLAAALIVVWRQRETLADARAALLGASPVTVAKLGGAVAANVVLSGLVFSLLMSRYGRVGRLEMQALVAATALFNYLPLRAGLIGRLAWHRTVNGIPLADSAKTVVQAIGLSVAVAAWLALVLMVCAALAWPVATAVLAPLPVLAAAGAWRPARVWAWAAALRLVDVLAWAVRYHAAFALLGAPIDATAAIVLACVSILATMVPFLSNGLGLREWAIALAAPLLTAWHLELSLTAELVNRAAEVLVILGLGGAGTAFLMRRRRRLGREKPKAES